MPRIIKVSQADIEKVLTGPQRANPEVMRLIDVLLSTYTQLEAILGYDLQWETPPLGPNSPVVPTPAPAPVAPSGELVDPPFHPDASEECGLASSRGLLVRLQTWYPSTGEWLAVSRVDVAPDGSLRVVVGGGQVTLKDWTEAGYSWHVRGWRRIEPGPGEVSPALDWTGNTAPYEPTMHAIIECRRE